MRIDINNASNTVSLPILDIAVNDQMSVSFVHAMSGDVITILVTNTESGLKYVTFVVNGTIFRYEGQYAFTISVSGEEVYKGFCVVYSEPETPTYYQLNNTRDNVIYT